ncbi:MAG: tetratricopeptide repeat protein [Pirellulales bacterium]|nr:tetratricopeptide repeat protein [Pirellulales bacterium]
MPNFSVNVRLLTTLVIVMAVAAVGVFLLHRYQVGRHSDEYLEQAQECKKKLAEATTPEQKIELFGEAAQSYRQYLSIKPNDLDAATELAQMQVDVGLELTRKGYVSDGGMLLRDGCEQMEGILRRRPDDRKLRRALVEALVMGGQYRSALEHLELLCEVPKTAEELRALFDKEDLWHRLEGTGISSPEQRDVRALSGLLKIDGDTVDRQKLMTLLGNDFWVLLSDPALLRMCGLSWAMRQKPEAAVAPLERSILIAPARLETYSELVSLLQHLKRFSDADYYMDLVVRANSDSYLAYLKRSAYRQSMVGRVPQEKATQLALGAVSDAVAAVRTVSEQILEKAQREASTSPTTADLSKAFRRLPEEGTPLTPDYRSELLEVARRAKALDQVLKGIDEEMDGLRKGLILTAQAAIRTQSFAKNDPAGQPEVASEFAQAAVELFPDDASAYLVLAEVEERARNQQKAIEWLRRGRERTHNNKTVLWQLSGLLIDANRPDEAEEILAILKQDKSKAVQTLVAHRAAQIEFTRKNWLAAAKGFEEVLPVLADWPDEARKAYWYLGECYGHLGRFEDQRNAYNEAAKSDQSWLPALIGIAQAKADTGRLDEAIEDYRLILKHGNAPRSCWLKLAELLLVKNLQRPKAEREWSPFEEAIQQAEKALPGSTGVVVLRAKALAARDSLQKAVMLLNDSREALIKEVRQLHDQQAALLEEAKGYSGQAKQARLDKAKHLATEARNKKADLPLLWNALVQLLQREGNTDAVQRAMTMAEGELGDSPLLRVMKAQNLVVQGGEGTAEQLRQLAEKTEAFSPLQKNWLWRRLASLSLQVDDEEQTEILCRRVLKDQPGSVDVQQLRFQVAARQGDDAAMERILQELRDQEESPSAFRHFADAYWRFHRAGQNHSSELLDEARKSINSALSMQPRSASYCLLAAQIYSALGDQDAALENYLRAVDLGIRDPKTIRRVARLLSQRNRFAEADRMFRLLGESQTDLSDQTERELGQVKFRLGEYQEALKLARKVAANSNDFHDQIWLGRLLSIIGKQAEVREQKEEAQKLFSEAEGAFRQAVIYAMDKPETWVALIQFYGMIGRNDDAEKTIDWARRKLVPDNAAGALAQCYEAIGRFAEAAQQYDLAVSRAPDDPDIVRRAATFYFGTNQPAKGEALLKRILSGNANANPGQMALARQMMARALLDRGGKENLDTASRYVENNLKADPNSVADKLLWSVITISRGGDRDRDNTIQSLEEYLQTQRTSPPEIQFFLAGLYLEKGEWHKYKPLMRSLLQTNARNVHYLAPFIQQLLHRQELNEAKVWLDKLDNLAPDSAVTARLRAEYAFRTQRHDVAVQILRDWVENPRADVSDRAERLRLMAEILAVFAKQLQDTGQTAAIRLYASQAEQVYEDYLETKPGQKLMMANFLAQQGRIEDALARIERDWTDSDPSLVAVSCFNVINGTEISPQQMGRIDQVLEEAIRRHPDATVLRIVLATVRDREGKFADAERIFRRILQTDPDNLDAMNNLALLLALNRTQLDEANLLIDRALKKAGPKSSLGFLDTRAIIRMAMGKSKEALEDLARVVRLEPTPTRYFHQAQAFYQAGQKKSAVDALKKAHEMGLNENRLSPVERGEYRRLEHALK